MQRCFELALQGLGTTWPNPLVGAVIIKNGKIIGEGFHRRPGTDHAEADALKNCTESPEGATIYVNLEPCCHTNKRTPPCAQRLIKEGIKKVMIANLDPNPHVDGSGVKLLQEAGIEVEHGILAPEGEKLNEVFFLAQRQKRPFVHLKLATTLDGKIALPSGESQWITGEKARAHVHLLRSQHQAVMVGAETVRKDDPGLTVRLPDYAEAQPYRVVISRSGNLPEKARLFTDEHQNKTLVYKSIAEAMQGLFEKNIISVFLEGGAHLATAFMKLGLVDRVSVYLNPSFLGAGKTALEDFGLETLAQRPRLENVNFELLGEDLFLSGNLKKDK